MKIKINEGVDQLQGYFQLIYAFVYTYAKRRFSHDATPMCPSKDVANLHIYRGVFFPGASMFTNI